jgi:hypothetical protein
MPKIREYSECCHAKLRIAPIVDVTLYRGDRTLRDMFICDKCGQPCQKVIRVSVPRKNAPKRRSR